METTHALTFGLSLSLSLSSPKNKKKNIAQFRTAPGKPTNEPTADEILISWLFGLYPHPPPSPLHSTSMRDVGFSLSPLETMSWYPTTPEMNEEKVFEVNFCVDGGGGGVS